MKKLQQIWDELSLKSDKGDVHSYLPVYDEILAPYRTTAKNILEIGLFNGASFLMWEQYFYGTVYGVDCSETPHDGMADLRPLIAVTHNIFILDAENPTEVRKYFNDIRFDVIIEDAGHDLKQQARVYEVFKPYIQKGGIYIIEDIQDIDKSRWFFLKNIDEEKETTIIDRRDVKGRYDDVLVIIKDKK